MAISKLLHIALLSMLLFLDFYSMLDDVSIGGNW